MTKRQIAMVVAGLMMGAAGVAAGNRDASFFSSEGAIAIPEAAQVESMPAEVAVVEIVPVEVVRVETVPVLYVEPVRVTITMPAQSNAFPQSTDDLIGKPLPAQAAYLEQRAANLQVSASRGDTFPLSTDDVMAKPLPALAAYLDQKDSRIRAAYDYSSSNIVIGSLQ